MNSELRTQINRQGWRIVDRAPSASSPRIDHRKRQVNADTALDLAEAYLELRGWPQPEDLAERIARAYVITHWAATEQAKFQLAEVPTASEEQARVARWASEGRDDILPALTESHLSHDSEQELAGQVRQLLDSPELVRSVRVRHTFRVLA
jgi:hypothetical protein